EQGRTGLRDRQARRRPRLHRGLGPGRASGGARRRDHPRRQGRRLRPPDRRAHAALGAHRSQPADRRVDRHPRRQHRQGDRGLEPQEGRQLRSGL
ncbi:MAG: DNA-binding protein HU-beta, partial [uncultured Blastococcus sp.]